MFKFSFLDNTKNVKSIHKKGIIIINNVYQSKYNYNRSNCTGLGDFIRGCYFMLEFCDKFNFQPKIIFNNCISKFLNIKTHNLHLIDNLLKSIDFFKNNNFKEYNIQNSIILDPFKDNNRVTRDFINYICDSPTYYGNVFLFCNSYPINNVIPEKHKQFIRRMLEPTTEMINIVKKVLKENELINKQYSVIHIRSGDAYLKNKNNTYFDNKYITKLIDNIKVDITDINKKYLIIADNNQIKLLLKQHFSYLNFIIITNDITHFGEGIELEEEKVKNTLIDFYLLSESKDIISYSCYKHGSGFSYWCAKTFNIPYLCKYI